MTHAINLRIPKLRTMPRLTGLRSVRLWVPDTRRAGFAEECSRQCAVVAQADRADTDMQHFMNAALADVDGWTN